MPHCTSERKNLVILHPNWRIKRHLYDMNKAISSILRFARDWTLPISMISGALAYFAWVNIPGHEAYNDIVNQSIAWIQPIFIFAMLFVSFCKVKITDFTLKWWHLWLLIFQVGIFTLLAITATLITNYDAEVVVQSAMLCMICPTATAAAVVTSRLGGNQATLVSYTIMINLAAAIAVPVVVPIVHTEAHMQFWPALWAILVKVFPLLICPLFFASLVRNFLPRLHALILRAKDLPFYLWAFSLALAIGVSAKSLMHTTVSIWCQVGIAVASLLACLAQFGFGKYVGTKEGERISAGQACGQKNTVFAIWLGYTFMDPVTALAGGFYSIWHNVINSYQLYKKRKKG